METNHIKEFLVGDILDLDAFLLEINKILEGQGVFVSSSIKKDESSVRTNVTIVGDNIEISGHEFINKIINTFQILEFTPKMNGNAEISINNRVSPPNRKHIKGFVYEYSNDLKRYIELFDYNRSYKHLIETTENDEFFIITIKSPFVGGLSDGLHGILSFCDKIKITTSGVSKSIDDENFIKLEMFVPKDYKNNTEYRNIRFDIEKYPSGAIVIPL